VAIRWRVVDHHELACVKWPACVPWVEFQLDEGIWVNPDCCYECDYCHACLGCQKHFGSHDGDFSDEGFRCLKSPDGEHHVTSDPGKN